MSRYLLLSGIAEKDIFTDSFGNNTRATARYTKQLLDQRKWHSAIIVTQYFHIPRCLLAFHQEGVGSVYASYPDYFEWRDLFSILREMIGLPYYFFKTR